MKVLIRIVAAGLLLAGAAAPGQAQSVAEFYKGKTVRLIVPAAAGDSYDTEARLIARHLTKYIPGNPTIVPENMPGASGRNAASYISNVAPKDGTVLSLVQMSANRHPELPNVPRLIDLAPNENARQIFELMSVAADIGRPMVTAPSVPVDRVKALREAFAKTMQDPDFQKEAARLSVDIDPTVGEDLQKLVEKVLSAPQSAIDLQNATVLKDM